MNGALFSYPRPNGCGLEAVMSSFKHLQTCRQLCCSSYQINMSDRHGSTPNPFRRNTFSCFGIDVPAWRAKKKIQVTPKLKAGLGGLVGVSWNADLHQYVTPQNPGNCGKSLNNKASIVGSFPSVAVCQDVVTGIPWKRIAHSRHGYPMRSRTGSHAPSLKTGSLRPAKNPRPIR